jgi:DNA-binding transcriptional LysR family regulator
MGCSEFRTMRGPDLDDLAAFAAIARHRSFRKAAAERGVSASTLSQTLRDLEARLDLRLLNRTTRSVALTEAGARLLERLSPALSEIAGAVDQLHQERGVPAGLLRINAPEPAVGLVLAPMIGPFLAAYPKVELEIISETSFVDIVAGGFDAGVRWDESLAKDMVAVPLSGPQRYVVAAAPGLIARVGMPKAPEDLLSQPCIRVRYPSGVRPPWEFERAGRVLKLEPRACFASTSLQAMMQAALDGAGFILTFEAYAAEHVAAGRLVTLLDDWQPPFPGPFLYYPSRRHAPGPLRAFIDFVKAWPRG